MVLVTDKPGTLEQLEPSQNDMTMIKVIGP